MISAAALLALLAPKVIEVGDGKPFSRIEAALAGASAGDEIDVFPSKRGYLRTALYVTKQVQIIARGPIALSGKGFDYSGIGKTPRAIVQFEPGSSGSFIKGFKIADAHNKSFNGAGIRIREANNVSVWQCELAHNDMGAMSNGKDGEASSAAKQKFVSCVIHDNGNPREPGNNHNLYLGGASVYLDGCLIYNPLTGHNLKSRAHFTSVSNCVFYGGDNRQIDCVDSWFTTPPNSDLIVYNSVLAMNPNANGNRNVIHFGQEKGKRDGCAYIYQSSIFTSFITPVVALDSHTNRTEARNCEFINSERGKPRFCASPSGDSKDAVRGESNLFSPGYRVDNLHAAGMPNAFAQLVQAPNAIPGIKGTDYGLRGDARLRMSTLPYRGKLFIPLSRPGASPNLYRTIARGLGSRP